MSTQLQPCLAWSYHQHRMPRHPAGVTPSHASGSGHTDLGPDCEPEVVWELAPAPQPLRVPGGKLAKLVR